METTTDTDTPGAGDATRIPLLDRATRSPVIVVRIAAHPMTMTSEIDLVTPEIPYAVLEATHLVVNVGSDASPRCQAHTSAIVGRMRCRLPVGHPDGHEIVRAGVPYVWMDEHDTVPAPAPLATLLIHHVSRAGDVLNVYGAVPFPAGAGDQVCELRGRPRFGVMAPGVVTTIDVRGTLRDEGTQVENKTIAIRAWLRVVKVSDEGIDRRWR